MDRSAELRLRRMILPKEDHENGRPAQTWPEFSVCGATGWFIPLPPTRHWGNMPTSWRLANAWW